MENKEILKSQVMENANEVNNKFFSEYEPIHSNVIPTESRPGLGIQPDASLIFG